MLFLLRFREPRFLKQLGQFVLSCPVRSAKIEKYSGDMNMLLTSEDVLLQFGWDCLNISIYNPDEEIRMLFEKIAASEGMLWKK